MAHNLITAVVFRGREAEWTTVKVLKGVVEVVERRTESMAPEAAVPGTPAFTEAVAGIGSHLRGDVCFAVRSDRVLMRVVDLPTADAAEMAGMVDLQVDKFLPFPVEHMAVTFEQLSQQGTSSRVLIAAIQKDMVTAVGDVACTVTWKPRILDRVSPCATVSPKPSAPAVVPVIFLHLIAGASAPSLVNPANVLSTASPAACRVERATEASASSSSVAANVLT